MMGGGSGPSMGMVTPSKESVVKKLRAADMLPAIWFIFSRATCDQSVLQMHKAGVNLVTADERIAIMAKVSQLRCAHALMPCSIAEGSAGQCCKMVCMACS